MREKFHWKWIAFHERVRALKQRLYILKFWRWVLWRPSEPWSWKFPGESILEDASGIHYHIDEDLQKVAIADWREWVSRNPAPRWWKIWCKIFCRDNTHEYEGVLGKAIKAVPAIVSTNTILHLNGSFPEPEVTKDVVLKAHVEHGVVLIIDGGPKSIHPEAEIED